MPSPALFELRSAGYAQQGATLIDNVSWTVEPGEHWAILGPNGAGKTTLLKIATGYLWQTSGCVLRQGLELKDLGEFRRQIGWISADIIALIPPEETGLETVVSGKYAQFGLKYLQSTTPTADDFQTAADELTRIGCEDLIEKRFLMLSQGERQQVLVARTQMAEPTLLVLDEPCAGMDPGVRERFLAWLAKQFARPAFPTTLFVTHHIEEITPGTSHALIMVDGGIYAAGPVDDIVTAENLTATFGARVMQVENRAGRRWPIWQVDEAE